MSVSDAAARIGLAVQLFCKADPSSWDPIRGSRSPVHFAGKVHRKAFERALTVGAEKPRR